MTTESLRTAEAWQATIDFRARQRMPKPRREDARAFLADIGRATQVTTPAELDALGNGAVVRDAEGWVAEKFGEGASALWYATRSTKPRTPHLPAEVYHQGDEQ